MKDKQYHSLMIIPKRNNPTGINTRASALALEHPLPESSPSHCRVTPHTVMRTHHRILIPPLTLGSSSLCWCQLPQPLPSSIPARHCGPMVRCNPSLLKSWYTFTVFLLCFHCTGSCYSRCMYSNHDFVTGPYWMYSLLIPLYIHWIARSGCIF